jgi:glycosyltransferase involved in cell wall biosynthesis
MTAVPDISVVMGVFNNAATLPAALDSILSQEGVGLEFIVVDDGSTDGSAAILDEAARKDSRLRVVHKENEGLTRALIDGCALAVAPWIARQDADDVSLPGRLLAQLARARQPDAPVLVGCGAAISTPAGEKLMEIHPPTEILAAKRRVLGEGQAISPHGSILFRRAAYEEIGGYRKAFYYAQDIDLMTRLAEGGPVTAVPELFYEYRFSPAAISGRQGRFQRAFYRLIRQGHDLRRHGRSDGHLLEQAGRLRMQCLRRRKGRAPSFEGLYFIGACLLGRQPERACAYFRQALSLHPWSAKALFRWGQAIRQSRKGGRR